MIFDYDGVVGDTFTFHLNRYNKLFPEAGLTSPEFARVHEGNFNERDGNVWSKIDLDLYDKELGKESSDAKLISEKVVSFIDSLQTRNYIVSSGPEKPITDVIRDAGLVEKFCKILGRETDPSKVIKLQQVINAEGIKPQETFFITDTLGDVYESHKVGVPVIAVTFGFHSRETLEKGNPEYIVDSWSEVENILSSKGFTIS